MKVTTNQIERIWVELRKILRGVKRQDIPRRLSEVPYRLMTMVPGMHSENLFALLQDLAGTVTLRQPQMAIESPFVPVRDGYVIE